MNEFIYELKILVKVPEAADRNAVEEWLVDHLYDLKGVEMVEDVE